MNIVKKIKKGMKRMDKILLSLKKNKIGIMIKTGKAIINILL